MYRFGLALASVGLVFASSLGAQQKIAFTWDDLPVHSSLPPGETRQQIIDSLIGTIKAERLPAPYGFVNARPIESQPELRKVLDAWRAAGFPLGNHTWSHLNLNSPSTTIGDWEADVLKDEPVLQEEMKGADFHWLRFPNLSEGNTVEKRLEARRFLVKHGYKIAGVTMSFADYAFNEPYARCVANGDDAAVKKLEDSYLQEALKNLKYAQQISQRLYGRDIPYILLMHVGAFDARMLPRLLALYRQQGATFISLQEASADSFYKNDLDPSLDQTPDTLEAAMQIRGLPLPALEPASVDLAALCVRK